MGWWSPVDKAVGNGGASTAVGAVSAANAISWLVTVPVVGKAAGVGASRAVGRWSHGWYTVAVGAVSAANAISWLVTVPVVGIAAGVGAMSWSHERRWLVVVTR